MSALVGGWLGFHAAAEPLLAVVTTIAGATAATNLALILVGVARERAPRPEPAAERTLGRAGAVHRSRPDGARSRRGASHAPRLEVELERIAPELDRLLARQRHDKLRARLGQVSLSAVAGGPEVIERGASIGELPNALTDREELDRRLAGRRPAVFLDYDGTLTPIVDRPEDAVISESMRVAVRAVARRCTVCVVSGRDRKVVQELMGVDDLVVAGSHGFDIWSPAEGTIEHQAGAGFEDLLERVTNRLHEEVDSIEGALIEPKKASVAIHYRLVSEPERPRIREIVEGLLAAHPDELKVTPGKMVYELQPKLEWDKGRAVLYLLEALGLDRDELVPLYLGDDITDEHAFEALAGRGIGVFVGSPDDPEVGERRTAADFVLASTQEVERFLDALAR